MDQAVCNCMCSLGTISHNGIFRFCSAAPGDPLPRLECPGRLTGDCAAH